MRANADRPLAARSVRATPAAVKDDRHLLRARAHARLPACHIGARGGFRAPREFASLATPERQAHDGDLLPPHPRARPPLIDAIGDASRRADARAVIKERARVGAPQAKRRQTSGARAKTTDKKNGRHAREKADDQPTSFRLHPLTTVAMASIIVIVERRRRRSSSLIVVVVERRRRRRRLPAHDRRS